MICMRLHFAHVFVDIEEVDVAKLTWNVELISLGLTKYFYSTIKCVIRDLLKS